MLPSELKVFEMADRILGLYRDLMDGKELETCTQSRDKESPIFPGQVQLPTAVARVPLPRTGVRPAAALQTTGVGEAAEFTVVTATTGNSQVVCSLIEETFQT